MADPFVAEIRIFPFNFAPKGWAFCDGQLLPISQNTALFSLLGTIYGGDGRSTFALPNLQGSVPMFYGQGPGLSSWSIGETGGSETVSLLSTEIPSHTHTINASGGDANTSTPAGNAWGQSEFGDMFRDSADVGMNENALSLAGASLPHNNLQPYLTLNFCIALQGVYPQRS